MFTRLILAVLTAAFATGCVTIYQPLVSLREPVAVNPRLANFEGVKMLVRCLPGEHLSFSEAQSLCRHVSTLFRNQGAELELEVPREGRAPRGDSEAKRHELIVELRARQLHRENNGLLNVVSIASFTIIPSYTDYTIAQDVTIRDSQGALLLSDTLQARFVEYYGAGIWSVNWVLDVLVRDDHEELTGDAPHRDFTRDFDGHLSQLVLNARVRSVVLRDFQPLPPSAAAN